MYAHVFIVNYRGVDYVDTLVFWIYQIFHTTSMHVLILVALPGKPDCS